MNREALTFVVGLITSMYLWFSAILVWGIWIHRYVQRSGRKTAPFSISASFMWEVLADYKTARLIAAEQRHTPWFLRYFTWSAGLGMAGIIMMMGYICVSAFW